MKTHTQTGRLPMQNIPIRTELGRAIRKSFRAPPANIDFDYAAAEAATLALMRRRRPR